MGLGLIDLVKQFMFKNENPPIVNAKYFIHPVRVGEEVFFQDRDNIWRKGEIFDTEINTFSKVLMAKIRFWSDDDNLWHQYRFLPGGFFRNDSRELSHLLSQMKAAGANPDTFYWWPEELIEELQDCREAWKEKGVSE
jgi:hypothetical protein